MPHDLRHTAASLAIQSGANLKVVVPPAEHREHCKAIMVCPDRPRRGGECPDQCTLGLWLRPSRDQWSGDTGFCGLLPIWAPCYS